MYKLILDKAHTLIRSRHAVVALVVLVFLNILIAVCIGNKFGEGWDETEYYIYGERSLDAYIRGMSGLALIPDKHIFFNNLRYYGPFYAVIGKLATDFLSFVLKNWSYEDIWHFVNFSFFQGGLICLYIVAKRFMRPWTAFGIVLLFATQPLIFGHAFINPKDIPLMTFFLASVASGLTMVDIHAKKIKSGVFEGSKNDPSNTVHYHSLIVAILFGLLTFSIVGKDVISSFNENSASFFYSIWGRLFSSIVGRANQPLAECYIHKAVNSKIELVAIIMILFLVIARPAIDEYMRKQKTGKDLKFIYDIDFYFIGKTLIAGIFLGLATSIRVVGPFAGLLIMAQSFIIVGKKSISNMIYYFSIAALTTYLTWPFLWDSPTYRFIESFEIMKKFPFDYPVKFMGNSYASANLPWTYLPTLITIQMTEPVIILFIIGFISSLWNFIKNPNDNKKLLIIYSWFIIPIGMFIILHSSAYDNFRQYFFILPPIFILSGMALDLICRRINHEVINLVLLVSLAIPGIIGITSLHPYEYIYYNSFVGGTREAAENFETDYWLTSYREAAFYLNANAPKGSKILALGASYNLDHNVRKDLHIFSFDSKKTVQKGYDYAVISTKYNSHITIFPNAEIIFEVRKNGVLLSVIKKLTR